MRASLLLAAAMSMMPYDVRPAQTAGPRRDWRKPQPGDTTRRYFGLTSEQREWNKAIDDRKAAKKAAKPNQERS